MAKKNRPVGLVYEESTLITANDRTMTLSDWARETGLSKQLISKRLVSGWLASDAVLRPARNYRRKPPPSAG
jgi:hypothetical protein